MWDLVDHFFLYSIPFVIRFNKKSNFRYLLDPFGWKDYGAGSSFVPCQFPGSTCMNVWVMCTSNRRMAKYATLDLFDICRKKNHLNSSFITSNQEWTEYVPLDLSNQFFKIWINLFKVVASHNHSSTDCINGSPYHW